MIRYMLEDVENVEEYVETYVGRYFFVEDVRRRWKMLR